MSANHWVELWAVGKVDSTVHFVVVLSVARKVVVMVNSWVLCLVETKVAKKVVGTVGVSGWWMD